MKIILKINETVETTVEITTDEQIAYRNNEIAKLNKKIEALQNLDNDALCQVMVKPVIVKLSKKIEAGETLLAEYAWSEVAKMRKRTESFASYLTDLGIEASLHGSAERARKSGQDAIDLAAKFGCTDEALIRESAIEKIGGKNSVWREAVINWLFPIDDESSEASLTETE